MKIKSIQAREILDSRGTPTVEAFLTLENGTQVSASVPSGTSAGTHEALELRDNDKNRFQGMGVLNAVRNINDIISPKLIGIEASDQNKVDEILIDLDGKHDKSNLGANAILAVSEATMRASSASTGIPLYETINKTFRFEKKSLPKPFSVIIEGGKHADSNVDIQEFMILCNDGDTKENIRKISDVYQKLGEILKDNGKNTNVGYEGAYAPDLSSNREGLDFMMQAITNAGLEPGKDIKICIDVAASEIYDAENKKYILKSENIALSSHQMVAYFEELVRAYPIFSIEDGVAEDDWEGWEYLNQKLGTEILLVGDDLFVTNVERIRKGIDRKAANSVLIKPNQIGTVSETVEAIKMAYFAGWDVIISHRSGETNETFIIDLAVGSGAKYCKIGAPSRGERVAKFNRLLEIGEELIK